MDLLTLPRSAASTALGLGTALRGARVFHPRGSGHTGTVVVTGGGAWGARLLDDPASYDVVVRVSRAAGLPEPLPDAIGIAIRFPHLGREGAPLDLLVNTAGSAPVLRHVFLPVPLTRTFTTVLPYRTGDGSRIMLGARPAGDLRWELLVAPLAGPWQPWGSLALGARLPDEQSRELRFMPTIGADDLQPVELFRALRARSYRKSQARRD